MKTIGIIGNGFVGSTTAFGFSLHTRVLIYDKDSKRSSHGWEETLAESEFLFVSVPTPMNKQTSKIDLSILDGVIRKISTSDRPQQQVVVIKSTVVPGTVERYVREHPNVKFVFNPEFLTERSARLDFINASRIILGGAESDVQRVEELYRIRFPYIKIIKTDITTAQFVKYMCNCFFAVKVSFMNEMKQCANSLAADWPTVMEGFVSDGRIGNSHLDVPGHDGYHGFGGKCFPKDLNAFICLFQEVGIDPLVMEAAWRKNAEVREEEDWLEIEGAVS
jgi:UDPglucose 6-dehydrogenase